MNRVYLLVRQERTFHAANVRLAAGGPRVDLRHRPSHTFEMPGRFCVHKMIGEGHLGK